MNQVAWLRRVGAAWLEANAAKSCGQACRHAAQFLEYLELECLQRVCARASSMDVVDGLKDELRLFCGLTTTRGVWNNHTGRVALAVARGYHGPPCPSKPKAAAMAESEQ